ncbi:MAG: hypothetical protein RL685_7168 [Pseudomonadota bacterium]|jgi:hypothetical protein
MPSEPAPRPSRDVRLTAPDRPWQHLAFSDERLAQLSDEQLLVRTLPELQMVARIDVPGGRNVVAGVGGDLVAAGSEHVYRLARPDRRAEQLAPVPRLGPTTIVPGADTSDHFWLLYEGISSAPEFDLQETVLTPYVSVLGWTELAEFDGRAVTSPGDGSFIYSTVRGLRRVDAEGGARDIALPDPGGDIWRLLADPTGGGLWVATRSHVQYLARVGSAEQSPIPGVWLELPPRTVAIAALGLELAILAVESIDDRRAQLRADVYTREARSPGSPRVLRLRRELRHDDTLPARPGVGPSLGSAPRFAPELALAPGRTWLAINGFGLSVFDWRTGKRRFPSSQDAQKLAPHSP